MKKTPRASAFTTARRAAFALSIALFASWSRGDTFLAIDFDRSANATNTQSGFTQWVVEGNPSGTLGNVFSVSPAAVDSGSVSVSIASSSGNFTARDRGTSAFGSTFANTPLYRDVLLATGTNTTMTLTFSGLNANTSYSLSFYALDASYSTSVSVYDVTNSQAFGQSIVYTAGTAASYDAGTSSSVAATSGVATTDETGTLVFQLTQTVSGSNTGQAFLNGFSLATIPEPAVGGALLGGVVLLCASFRRRRPRTGGAV